MWFKQVDVIVETTEQEEFLIKKRIDNIWDKAKFIRQNTPDDRILFYAKPISVCVLSSEIEYLCLTFDTANGKRTITIGRGLDIATLCYSLPETVEVVKDGYLRHLDTLFSITVSDTVTIQPKPMTMFTAKEMDLAILEFENILDDLYKKAAVIDEKHQDVVDYFSKKILNKKG